MSDKITILETLGRRLTKLYTSAGATVPYEDAASFKVKAVEVSSLGNLAILLGKLHKNPQRCLIRGTLTGTEPGSKPGTFSRTNANFSDQPLHWFMIDIDGFRPDWADPITHPELAVEEFFAAALPDCFKTCSYYWHLSSSAGMPGKEGILKAHLHFWSKTAYTTAQMSAWAKVIGPAIDSAIYRRVQVHYTADPVFEEGRTDPVAVRAGWHQGLTDEVDLVIGASILDQARELGAGTGGDDMKLVDPSEKEGLIGLFHRTYSAEDVLTTLLDGEFEQVSERRYTWFNGGGTPEGVWVHNDGNHVGSSHNTWPIDGIANLWDLVRVFKFADLDVPEGADDFEKLNAETLPVGQRPSDQAMYAWAGQLPELQAALVAERDGPLQQYRALIEEATEPRLLEEVVAAQIRAAADLSVSDRARLEGAYQARFKELTQTKLTIAVVRRLLAPSRNTMANEAPEWAIGWYWVTQHDCFIHGETKERLTILSYNAKFDRYMRPYADENGVIPKASDLALKAWGTEVVTDVMYNPAADLIFARDGLQMLNTYRAELLPDMPDSFSKKEQRAVDAVVQHLELLFPKSFERRMLTSWLAHCVQHPGIKIRWAPLIIGMPGDGKSVFITLLGLVLGSRNTRILSNKTLESDFTGWSTGQCFIGIEELMMHGHSRYDTYNSLKPLISNSDIEVHPKGRDPYNVPNFSNVMMLTNHPDAAPVTDDDRRLFFLQTPYVNQTKGFLRASILEATGLTYDQYFARLFDESIYPNAGALRRWLMDYPIDPEFSPNGNAPDTDTRNLAIELSKSDIEMAVSSVLEAGGVGIYPTLVSSVHMTRKVKDRHDQKIQGRTVSTIMGRLGWHIYGKQVFWRGDACRWYYRGPLPDHPGRMADALEKMREAQEVDGEFSD